MMTIIYIVITIVAIYIAICLIIGTFDRQTAERIRADMAAKEAWRRERSARIERERQSSLAS